MRVLRVLLAVLAVCAVAAAVLVFLAGPPDVNLGTLWNDGSPGSLNLTQAIVQRYIHPGVWTNVFLPVLLMPATDVFVVVALVAFVFWLLLMWRRAK